jgi:hypothetical protein
MESHMENEPKDDDKMDFIKKYGFDPRQMEDDPLKNYLNFDIIKNIPIESVVNISQLESIDPAERFYSRVCSYFINFEAGLDEEHEIGVRLVSFGNSVVFHILDLDYSGPDIITFYGQNEEGQKIQLIQNMSQFSVLLCALPKLEEKPKRIGFNLPHNDPKK